MANYKSAYTGEEIDAGITKANTAIQDISGKQDTLISGNNIKTINDKSILGSGNMTINSDLSDDVKNAILDCFENVTWATEEGQTYYDALEELFFPPIVVTSISAVFSQGQNIIYPTDSLDSLKHYLVVTATFDDETTQVLQDSDYTLSGTLTTGISTITATYSGKSDTFNVTVSAPVELTSISAVYTQSGTVYTSNSLDSLKTNLVVTATYSDSSTRTITSTDYTLSGNLTAGTSTITVIYEGKTTTFNVTVTAVELSYITATFTQGEAVITPNNSLDSLKQYLVVTAINNDGTSSTVAGENYTLSGTLAVGTSQITATYQNKTDTFSVIVTPSLVPSGYTQYDYLAYTGDSGTVYGNVNNMILTAQFDNMSQTKVEFDFMPLKTQSGTVAHIMGGRGPNSSSGNDGLFAIYGRTDTKRVSSFAHGVAVAVEGVPNVALNKIAHVIVDPGTQSPASIDVDGLTATTAWSGNSYNQTEVAFCGTIANRSGSNTINDFAAIGIVKFYDVSTDELIGQYVPCVRNADNVIGAYDTVTEQFYTTGTTSYATIGNSNLVWSVGNWN